MSGYKEMTKDTIGHYLKSVGIFPKDHETRSREIGDGNLNYVFRVVDLKDNKKVIVKQALPYLRIAGEGWKLTLDRNRIEAETLKLQGKVCPGSVPKIYHHSNEYALTVMEDLGNMEILRKAMMEMKTFKNFPQQIGKFMARNLFLTSDMGMGPMEKKKIVGNFISPELCDITERLVLNDPYMNAESNDINQHIKDYVKEKIWKNKEICLEVSKLKNIFMTKAESLLHGDLHTGSIFINNEKTIVFDCEFAFYGPYGYDIGLLFANFILNYASWEGRKDKTKEEIKKYRAHLLDSIKEIWREFVKEFNYLWENQSKDIITKTAGYREYYLENLLHETIGFCACEIMRRIIGMAHVPDMDAVENLEERARAQILGLKIGQAILIDRDNINSIDEFVKSVKNFVE
ncbi:S-methyl-5-thioribose kinase [Clostridium luticellarii]|jgi:5-methylthioribose kinase|uniref:S-methyl-5-thioribose kinase n=1 Tax=Clostridium luticellarii TaxID=1691940 RepID=A0A2T0BC72_9CLOT|nr:S-methyl-5-thioribose kinase [Clostridium luticellarii]MCI1946222.1 S-methyl-5-thioribose kinase [Clostridium luticellarii]MCI1969521.1 S-methyl-5-thioribose kinase [Clostridium luticellarii]MCI1996715.1 S-methyl-5-thioribose kinase [Clostridium luticellarii]MCI2041009.1 S-methyl-5-thioribose kinase [Clostridium luticellarii]PRR81433.1 Methylthioribose kinase [Clostridium luticellarii]